MKYEVVRNIDRDTLQPLLRAARRKDHHALGEHKWLDVVFGKNYIAITATEDDGALTGYAHLSRHGSGWGLETAVLPERRADVSEELVRRALEVAAEEGGGHVHYWVFCPDDLDHDIAQKAGLRKGRDLLHVCVPLPIDYDVPMPPGVTCRAFEPGRDEDAWLDVNNRAFAGHPEQGDWDRETLERRMKEPWFDPDDFLVATDDAGIAGFNWTKLYRDRREGEIYVIGVDPDRKAGGLGKALLVAGLRHMADKGMETCCLYVDEANDIGLAMYTKLGFTEEHRDRAYVIDV
jgi:mycothiol synthase